MVHCAFSATRHRRQGSGEGRLARDHRRLAAIVLLDVVGYSRLMGLDDRGTLAALKAHRRELIDPKIAEHGGRIVKTTGDGLLLEFSSADAALRCAVDVQRGMAARNSGIAPDQRLDFRIGINLGDIIVDGDDIAGDGVNVAARLEALAEPGGICVSGSVREQVHGNVDAGFNDIGEQQVKNISRPIRVFAVALDSEAIRRAAAARPAGMRSSAGPIASRIRPPWLRRSWTVLVAAVVVLVAAGLSFPWWASRTIPASEPPAMSVGVMPLVAPPGDSETTQRAALITEDIAAKLSRTGTLITMEFVSSEVDGRKVAITDLDAGFVAVLVERGFYAQALVGGDAADQIR